VGDDPSVSFAVVCVITLATNVGAGGACRRGQHYRDAGGGNSESRPSRLIGHKGHSITSRYVHSADAVLLAAADMVAGETAARTGDAKMPGDVVPLRRAGASMS
jgi:hypothetical protein